MDFQIEMLLIAKQLSKADFDFRLMQGASSIVQFNQMKMQSNTISLKAFNFLCIYFGRNNAMQWSLIFDFLLVDLKLLAFGFSFEHWLMCSREISNK